MHCMDIVQAKKWFKTFRYHYFAECIKTNYIMKNHIIYSFLTLIFLSSSVKAADFFVYSSAQAPDYSTIQSAVNAASNNDNIYIDSTVFTENVTIDKSLSFYPLNKGSRYTINGV